MHTPPFETRAEKPPSPRIQFQHPRKMPICKILPTMKRANRSPSPSVKKPLEFAPVQADRPVTRGIRLAKAPTTLNLAKRSQSPSPSALVRPVTGMIPLSKTPIISRRTRGSPSIHKSLKRFPALASRPKKYSHPFVNIPVRTQAAPSATTADELPLNHQPPLQFPPFVRQLKHVNLIERNRAAAFKTRRKASPRLSFRSFYARRKFVQEPNVIRKRNYDPESA